MSQFEFLVMTEKNIFENLVGGSTLPPQQYLIYFFRKSLHAEALQSEQYQNVSK